MSASVEPRPAEGPAPWPGRFYAGRHPLAQGATARFEQQALVVSLADPGEPVHVWPLAEVEVVMGRLPGQPVVLRDRRAPEAQLVVAAPGFLAAWSRHAGASPHLLHDRSRGWWSAVALGAFAGLAATTSLVYAWLLPGAAMALAPAVPVAWERPLGDAMLPIFAPEKDRLDDYAVGENLRALGDRLVGGAYRPRIVVANYGEVNALALPGGTIVVYRDLIEAMARPEAMMGVLAHEIAHVELRHTTRHVLHGLGSQAVMTTLLGDTSMGMLSWTLTALSYSRALESEADAEGMRRLQAAGADPTGMVEAFETLERLEGRAHDDAALDVEGYLSSHPATSDRIAELRAMAAKATYRPRPIELPSSWQEMRRDLGVEE